ncbi:hypothetical protein [Flexibacterium corallicola]|uniref:hypothetical protein n=1 Tax=Flexibacterium corallicola TaxID=3037259 RepID=UPI00286F0EE1|nr:hypothetical protein [Pseudovibrio sp. M1P-2-3]
MSGFWYQREPIEGLPRILINGRAQIFDSITKANIPIIWPYGIIKTQSGAAVFNVAEACALTFLKEAGCNAVYLQLSHIAELTENHPTVKELSQEFGVSKWAIVAAARKKNL